MVCVLLLGVSFCQRSFPESTEFSVNISETEGTASGSSAAGENFEEYTLSPEEQLTLERSVFDYLFPEGVKESTLTEYETYDGWYNNPAQPYLGTVGSPLIRLLPPSYEDGVLKPKIRRENANPLNISNLIMEEDKSCSNCAISACSRTGKNVLMVFFGQFVSEEIMNTQVPSCPPEYFSIKIPSGNHFDKVGPKHMPFVRTVYDKQTGKSPNNPREQITSATAWIDGSVIYGISKPHSDTLRSFENGQLLADPEKKGFPAPNNGYLSYLEPKYSSAEQFDQKKSNAFRIGNPLGHENPYVLTFSILFFRWHNYLAENICKSSGWSDEMCFNEARKWVIATLQHIIIDEWLPEYLGEPFTPYSRYDPSTDPGVSHAFQSAAMRFGHTLVPAGVYWKKPNDCKPGEIRLCNSFYEAEKIVLKHGIGSLLTGMAFQSADPDDVSIVDDLRKYLYGPPEFTRRDLMALNIQRGRDHGLPGYGVARKLLVPGEHIKDLNFSEMANKSDPRYNEIITGTLPELYESMDDVDLWVGGLLETKDGPGPVFKEIIREQFTRIRDGDRFWFENRYNGLFTDNEIRLIKNLHLYDIVAQVVKDTDTDLHKELFHVPTDHGKLSCKSQFFEFPCVRPDNWTTCYAYMPLRDTEGCSTFMSLNQCSKSAPQTYDYFTGSGASFVLTFLFLFIFVLACIATLVFMVKRRERKIAKQQEALKMKKRRQSDDNFMYVSEWVNKKEGIRPIIVKFNPERKHLTTHLLTDQTLRSVDFSNVRMIELQVSTGGYLYFALIRVAREYDMILRFDTEEERTKFIEKLENFLGATGIGRQRCEVTVQTMLKNAVTKADRQVELEKFFRVVFAQAFSIEHDQNELLNLDSNQAREIINTELTAYEFAETLSLRPDAVFVKQMFALVDTDGNGYISFREFLNMIIIFAKGSPDDKAKLMFDIYDIDHSGKLTRAEFSSMIKSMLELANQSLSPDQIDQLTTSIFKAAGLQNKQELTFQDFLHLLSDHREELGYMQLSFDVGSGFKAAPTTNARQSAVIRAQETVVRAYSIVIGEKGQKPSRAKSMIKVETKPTVYPQDLTQQKVYKGIRFFENYKLHIFWAILYTLVICGIFIERAYYYSVEREHTGIRKIAGYGATVTRGAASAMMFAFGTILLTMCRNCITFFRETFLHKYIPFDAAISMHKFIAFWALIFTAMHAIGHGINFYHISTQPVRDLQCLFSNFHLDPNNPPKFHYWCYQTITGFTGILLVLTMVLMYVFAVQYSRRHVFNAFWKTHNLYPILYLLMILHGMGGVLQRPIFYYYLLGPCVLFVLDRLISVSRKNVEISVVKAELLPSGVTHVEFKKPSNFEYRSGQWVRIACVALNSHEYHPFTLSSAPHEENLSLHIRAVGPWTTNLRSIYDANNLNQHAYPRIFLDGPYGEGHQDWFRYDISVLVGGGIGITPFASILKDVVFKSSLKAKITCKKLYFIWVTRTQKHFEWMTDIIREVEANDKSGLVDVHIFITQFYQKFDLRTTMLYICERHFQRVCNQSLFTGLRSTTHFGRPDFKVFFNSLQQEHPCVNKIAVFSCGPPLMTRGVQLTCDELNKHDGAIFVHHYENF